MVRRAARKDDSQDAIVAALKSAGATVEIIGKPLDLLIGHQGRWLLMECKSSEYEVRRKTPTRKRQLAFAERHPNGGPISTVIDVDGALRAIAALQLKEQT